MKRIDKADLEEYLGWAVADCSQYSERTGDTQVILAAAERANLISVFCDGRGLELDDNTGAAMLAVWILAFQMGREFESRSLDKALGHTVGRR